MTLEPNTHRNFYGRLRGKHLKKSQQAVLEKQLSGFLAENIIKDGELKPELLEGPLWLEIGFGGGEHLAHLMRSETAPVFLAAEPYINGIAQFLAKLKPQDHGRVWIHDWDVRALFDVLPDACLDRAYLLYPDPWPKKRHHRRRFVTPDHLTPLARVMKPGAPFYIATDIADYVRQALEEVPPAGFEWRAESAEDWRKPWPNWFSTRYEQKALREGRTPHYLVFKRLA